MFSKYRVHNHKFDNTKNKQTDKFRTLCLRLLVWPGGNIKICKKNLLIEGVENDASARLSKSNFGVVYDLSFDLLIPKVDRFFSLPNSTDHLC